MGVWKSTRDDDEDVEKNAYIGWQSYPPVKSAKGMHDACMHIRVHERARKNTRAACFLRGRAGVRAGLPCVHVPVRSVYE